MSDAVWKTLLLFESSALNVQKMYMWRDNIWGWLMCRYYRRGVTNVWYICYIWQKRVRLHMWSASGAPDSENLAHDKNPFYYLEADEYLCKCPSMFSRSVDNRQRLYCLVYYRSWHFCHLTEYCACVAWSCCRCARNSQTTSQRARVSFMSCRKIHLKRCYFWRRRFLAAKPNQKWWIT